MSKTTLVRIEVDLIKAVQEDASKAMHQEVPYGRAVAWMHGEIKRLKRIEKAVKTDITTVSLTSKATDLA